ncbi:MAG: Asp-tRNA(Asn)/Glu-tRNA(Gln) amidotransferase subunit GatC [Dehalococcoidales bacterium]|nr:Asp-tRNA(Asn)/Glu-tRNA(Gln) amidotransferase subunit GatC [Dehalococcoidales bacterium]
MLSREEVLHIARLARLAVSNEEVEKSRVQLSDILEHFEELKKLDTAQIQPTAQSIPLENVMRDDVIVPSLPPDDILANAPHREDNSFRVRAVLEE